MNSFVQGVIRQNNQTFTENGMPALKSTLNACVDLFFAIAASRGKDVIPAFTKALAEDREMALRMALWVRDIRDGQGERQIFRDILVYLEENDEQALASVFAKIPEMGRWDDLLVFKTLQWKNEAAAFISAALADGNGLCAKWMPRKGVKANELRSLLGWSPKFYRKTLVELSNTVEQLMCAGQWDAIQFGKLPSLAAARYQKAFGKRCPEAYAEYKASLVKGEAKINATGVYPYDIIKSLAYGDRVVAEAQWKALPNWLTEGNGIVPMIDVSGSMSCRAGDNPSLSCMDVAISLGMYISERQTGAFKNVYLTFHERPTLNIMSGKTLYDRFTEVRGANWGGSTNVEAGFRLILDTAIKSNTPQVEMPKYLVVLSDMQFNPSYMNGSDTAFQMVRRAYEKAGYEMPTLVFWNLNDRGSNTPVEHNQNGVAMVSGFSPSLMQSILGAKTVTPYDVMAETLMKPRYDLA